MLFSDDNLRCVKTKLLDISYFDFPGKSDDANTVLLFHGWPDDPHTWAPVASSLQSVGWRIVAPYLRGFGPTVFRQDDTLRYADPVTLMHDALDLADALNLRTFAVVGHDWGARVAYTLACLYPDRVSHCAAFSIGWGGGNSAIPLEPRQIQAFWYQWFIGLGRGHELLADTHKLTSHIWNEWCIARKPDAVTINRLAKCFENPDWIKVVEHYYSVRWGLSAPDPAHSDQTESVTRYQTIKVPTLCIHGRLDPCVSPGSSESKEQYFSGFYERILLDSVGHFPQFEAPEVTSRVLLKFFGL